MKKVLIITYYWPPSGGGGVQRWLKFAKYLRDYGWEPIIYTPEKPHFHTQDFSLERDVPQDTEVIRYPIWEPFALFDALRKGGPDKNLQQGQVLEKKEKTLKDELAIWIRGNLFLPDARMFWIRPSVKFLRQFIKEKKKEGKGIDLIVSTGPPHSMHLIAKKVARTEGVKWLADFRDPWSRWDILDKLKTSSFIKWLHRRLERHVLNQADCTLTVSPSWKQEFQKLGAARAETITNGFDTSDIPERKPPKAGKFKILHLGMINELRNPLTFWEVIQSLCEENPAFGHDLEIELVGMVSEALRHQLASNDLLSNKVSVQGYIPHSEVFQKYQESHVLLLILNDSKNAMGHIPGKFFEYMAAGRNILCLGPEAGDTASIIKKNGLGITAPPQDAKAIRAALKQLYEQYKKGQWPAPAQIECFSRKELTRKLAHTFDTLTASTG